jgi:hypothetical protein
MKKYLRNFRENISISPSAGYKTNSRADILSYFGANTAETTELLAYNQNVFAKEPFSTALKFPLPSEPHIDIWQEYCANSKTQGVWATLKKALVQLQFPIQAGISQTEVYRQATLQGIEPQETIGLVLQQPEALQLDIYQSLAGKIPVLLIKNRDDFVAIVRAITKRNEPVPIPDSMGACIVAGYNNWDRIRRYRQQWLIDNPDSSELARSLEFRKIIAHKELYRDRFILLSDGFYSNVSPRDLGLTDAEWKRLSLTIRLEHECTHYFTRRVFNSMRNNILDELIADYRGIVAAIGTYKADWFLRFLGLESFPYYREGGRLENYRGNPPISDGAFKILQELVRAAAQNLEKFHFNYRHRLKDTENETLIPIALTCLTLEELAFKEYSDRLSRIINMVVDF